MFPISKTMGASVRATFLIAVAASALVIAGCKGGNTQGEAAVGGNSNQNAESSNAPENDESRGATNLPNEDEKNSQQLAGKSESEFSPEYMDKIKMLGTCASIRKAQVFVFNRQFSNPDATQESLKGIMVHQAAIYTILNILYIKKLPENAVQNAISESNEFMNNNLVGGSLSVAKLEKFHTDNCNFADIAPLAKVVMSDMKEAYRDQISTIGRLGL